MYLQSPSKGASTRAAVRSDPRTGDDGRYPEAYTPGGYRSAPQSSRFRDGQPPRTTSSPVSTSSSRSAGELASV